MHKFVEQIPSVIIRECMLGKSYLKKKLQLKTRWKGVLNLKLLICKQTIFFLKVTKWWKRQMQYRQWNIIWWKKSLDIMTVEQRGIASICTTVIILVLFWDQKKALAYCMYNICCIFFLSSNEFCVLQGRLQGKLFLNYVFTLHIFPHRSFCVPFKDQCCNKIQNKKLL